MWEQGRESELGPQGQKYIQEKHGEEIDFEEPPYDVYEYDYNDFDLDIEY